MVMGASWRYNVDVRREAMAGETKLGDANLAAGKGEK